MAAADDLGWYLDPAGELTILSALELDVANSEALRISAMITTGEISGPVTASGALMRVNREHGPAVVYFVAHAVVGIVAAHLLEQAPPFQIPMINRDLLGFVLAYRMMRPQPQVD